MSTLGRESLVRRTPSGALLPMLVGTGLTGVKPRFQAARAEFVVELTLLLVPDDIVRVGDFLEALRGLGVVGVDVGVVFSRELTVRLADFVLTRSSGDTEHRVEVFFGHYF